MSNIKDKIEEIHRIDKLWEDFAKSGGYCSQSMIDEDLAEDAKDEKKDN